VFGALNSTKYENPMPSEIPRFWNPPYLTNAMKYWYVGKSSDASGATQKTPNWYTTLTSVAIS